RNGRMLKAAQLLHSMVIRVGFVRSLHALASGLRNILTVKISRLRAKVDPTVLHEPAITKMDHSNE
ncbi:MAG: hypothetical protein ACP5EP_12175, partial [Acidobacteriaceae bacterium]